ncbi:CotD family spore coat protein [Peribacillus sp. NPDC046944]|uniref:CotD family spore coat protein n=1 Tax=unclassified Peribacillus TaxID=2675266 RepID=UPI003D030DF1
MYFRNCGGYHSNVMGAHSNVMGAQSNVMGAQSNVMGAHSNVMGAQSNVMGAKSNVMGAQSNVMGAQHYPTAVSPVHGQTQALPTQTAPAQVSPTQQYVNTNVSNTVIPVIHPSHTTTVNKHCNTYKHYFPHTQSVVNECYTQNLICGMPPVNPCCPPRQFGY